MGKIKTITLLRKVECQDMEMQWIYVQNTDNFVSRNNLV